MLLVDDAEEYVGTIRLCTLDGEFAWMDIPLASYFPDYFRSLVKSRTSVIQSTLFAVHPSFRDYSLMPKLMLIREWHRLAIRKKIDRILTIVENKKSLLRFYERIGLNVLTLPRYHPYAKTCAVVIGGDVHESLTAANLTRAFELIAEGINC